MIRTAWVCMVVVLATLVLGPVAIAASLLRVRGKLLYYHIARSWSRVILWASSTPVVVHGLDAIDWSQPRVLVANHISGYDVLALAGTLPGPFSFIAKKELERVPIFGSAWKAAGHISIDRSDREKAIESMRRAGEKMIRERLTVVVFPEGTRSRTGEMQPFKKGAFVLASESGVPIVPVAIRGSDRIQGPDSIRVSPATIDLTFCAPIEPSGVGEEDIATLGEAARAAIARVLAEGRRPAVPANPPAAAHPA